MLRENHARLLYNMCWLFGRSNLNCISRVLSGRGSRVPYIPHSRWKGEAFMQFDVSGVRNTGQVYCLFVQIKACDNNEWLNQYFMRFNR